MNALESIRNFWQVHDHLATSGMPQPEHFPAIRQAGYDVVINLALPTSDYAMPNEGELVAAQGMTYIHIPVQFGAPQKADFDQFEKLMAGMEGLKVFVHCAANKRVSAFVFLYRLRRAQIGRADAERELKQIWEPDDAWRQFINQRLAETGQAPLGN